jgi:hypothetical protein
MKLKIFSASIVSLLVPLFLSAVESQQSGGGYMRGKKAGREGPGDRPFPPLPPPHDHHHNPPPGPYPGPHPPGPHPDDHHHHPHHGPHPGPHPDHHHHPKFLRITCDASEEEHDPCVLPRGEQGLFVCREQSPSFHPRTDEPDTFPICIPSHKSLEGDVCGCCGGECPEPEVTSSLWSFLRSQTVFLPLLR